jgi:hypothetical protein
MFRNNGVRRFCANIYDCPEAARFSNAKNLAHYTDQCGTCNRSTTYLDFMQHGLILSCRMCTLLSEKKGIQPQDSLGDCFQKHGRHCPLCSFEYTSLSERSDDWLKQASTIMRCFLGGVPKQELAQRLYSVVNTEGMRCSGLRNYIQEIMVMLDETTRDKIKQKILKVDRLTNLGILPD